MSNQEKYAIIYIFEDEPYFEKYNEKGEVIDSKTKFIRSSVSYLQFMEMTDVNAKVDKKDKEGRNWKRMNKKERFNYQIKLNAEGKRYSIQYLTD